MEIELAHRSLYNLLEIGAEKRELIVTELKHRKLGKTKALVYFARDNGYTVLVGSETIAKMLIKEYGYRHIRSVQSKTLDGQKGFVCDECCPKEAIDKMICGGQPIFTGFQKHESFYPIIR